MPSGPGHADSRCRSRPKCEALRHPRPGRAPDLRAGTGHPTERHAVGDLEQRPGAAVCHEVLFLEHARRLVLPAGTHPGRAPGARGAPRSRDPQRCRGRAPAARARAGSQVLPDHREEAEVVVGVGDQDGVAGLDRERQALVVGLAGSLEIVRPVRQAASAARRCDPDADVDLDGLREQLPEEAARLAKPASLLVPAPCRADDPQPDGRLIVGQRPGDRVPEVVLLTVEPAQRRARRVGPRIRAPIPPRPGRRTRRRGGPPVSAARRSPRAAPGRIRAGAGAPRTRRPRRRDPARGWIRTRLLSASDSRPPSRSISRSSIRRPPHRPPGSVLGGPAAREDREAPEEPLLATGQQLVTPVDRARSVRCRSGTSRAPPPRSRLRPRR